MTATAKNRNTPKRESTLRVYPVAAGALCLAGTIAVLNASGYAEPGTTDTGLITLGRFEKEVDNSSGAAGAVSVGVERGIFKFENLAGSLVSLTDVGSLCYVVDNQTVAQSDGGGARSPAGYVDHVESTGVWVAMSPISGASA